MRAVELFRELQRQPDRAAWVVGKQFLRSATSIGANVEEAQDASSRRDFVHRYSIAQRKARETRYWLRIMSRTDMVSPEDAAPMLDEAGQLYAILTAIIRTAKRNASA